MPCSECTERARLLAESEQLLADKRFKYQHLLEMGPFRRARLLGSYEHAVKTARANLERHLAECMEGVCRECHGAGFAIIGDLSCECSCRGTGKESPR